MGAYYMATIIQEDYLAKMYDTHTLGNGLKLMEHSYIGNNYVNHIMSLLDNDKQKLVWLCDYHEPDEKTQYVWNNVVEESGYAAIDNFEDNKYFIINHSKKLYIDIEKLHNILEEKEPSGWYIHPIPILCNSDRDSQGGGDFHKNDPRRATWCEDYIQATKEKPGTGYEDATEECLFFEGKLGDRHTI